jgi:hypothetical protein
LPALAFFFVVVVAAAFRGGRFLTKTVLAFIAGRLPLKKACMIGFLGQIILRTHREIAAKTTLA